MEKNTLEGRINVLREQIHAEERNEEHIKSRKEAITEELKGKEEQLADFEAEQNRIGEQNTEELNRLNRARQEISEKGKSYQPSGSGDRGGKRSDAPLPE